MQELRQSTAITEKIGPFLDSTDGVTPETSLTILQADVRLSKNGGNIAQKTEASACSHDELGYYDCDLDATDTGTLGRLKLIVHEAGACPVWHEYMVVTQNYWDSKYSTDKLEVDVNQIGGDAQSAADLKDFADAGYDPATHKVQGVVLADTCTTSLDMRGTDSAALASVCTEGRLAELDAGNMPADIDAIPTTAMRGTDSAALASVCTEGRLAELDAANIPADIDAIPTTAMRGTDSAALASVCTEGRLAELDAGNIPGDIDAIPTTAMRGTDNAATEAKQDIIDTSLDTLLTRITALIATKAEMDIAHGLLSTEAKQDILDTNVDTLLTRITAVIATKAEMDTAHGLLATPAQVATALTNIHLDHLFAATYDPANKPGVADALLNELMENDGGVARYTVNALEQAPSGSGASAEVIADAVWNELSAGHIDAGKAGAQLWTVLDKVRKILTNKVVVNTADSQIDVYEDNGTDIAFSFAISSDRRERTPL